MQPPETDHPERPDVPVTQPVIPPPTRRSVPILPMAIVVVALLAGGALFMSGYTMGRQTALEPGTPVSEDAAFRPFWDTYHTITERYAGGEVDREAIVQGAIRGMIDALGDPYSSYLTSQEYHDSLQGISGEFEGIGAEIATQAADGTQGCATLGADCRLVIVAPLAGSPAAKAGLRTGDLVLAADGVALDGLTVDGARERIRGPKGTIVTLSIQRGNDDPFALEITRDVIQQEEVESRDYADGSVGYVRLNGFSDRGATELADALRAHVDAKRTKLILDLRGNPGGYVTAARAVASQFIASGPVFWEQDAVGRPGRHGRAARRRRHERRPPDRVPHRRRQRLGQRDRGRRPAGHGTGAARRPDVVRQGNRPAMAGADRRGRCVPPDRGPLADPEQALDPRRGAGAGRPGRGPDGPGAW